MIVVRDVFNLKFGKAKPALNLIKPVVNKMNDLKVGRYRLMTDLVGNYYTLVLEGTFNNLDDYQKIHDQYPQEEWNEFYLKFSELVNNGYRDIWTVVE